MCLLNWKFSGDFSQSDLQEEEEGTGLVQYQVVQMLWLARISANHVTSPEFFFLQIVRLHMEHTVTLKMEITGYS
jgi:hypothetical protein